MKKRSKGFETASIALSIAAFLTSPCIYAAMPCAAIGIILALLSKGGEMTLSPNGKIGLILSSVALFVTIALFAIMFIWTVSMYGGIDGFRSYIQTITDQYMSSMVY